MIYTHLFWDFDGTLYNSYPKIARGMEAALAELGLPSQNPDEMLEMLKVSVYRTLCCYSARFGREVEELHECFHKHHIAEGFFPPYEGLEECLTRLSDAGARHYLYTHRDRRAWEQLERDGLKHLFAGGVTSEDGFPDKPAPDALLHLIRAYRLDSAACAMIGDRDIDILSGQNAGMAGILFDPDNFYPALKAEGRVKTMDELCGFVLSR